MASSTPLTLEFSSGIPVYKQIINFIYSEIGRGNFRQGDRLPTIKEMTEQLHVNPNTVAKAYRELDLKGIITSKRGDGSFVSAPTEKATTLTDEQKRSRLDELFGRVIAEAKAYGITETELLNHIRERTLEDE